MFKAPSGQRNGDAIAGVTLALLNLWAQFSYGLRYQNFTLH